MPEDRIPPAAKLATCPKCQHKFRLRKEEETFHLEEDSESEQEQALSGESEDEPADSDEASAGTERPSGAEDIWRQLEEDLDDASSAHGVDSGPEARDGASAEPQSAVPWENLESHGFFPALYRTVQRVMLTPADFFSELTTGGGFSHPTVFYLLLMEVPALALVFWLMSGLLPQGQGEAGGLFQVGLTGVGSVTFLLVFPVFMLVNLFVSSGMYHILLMALGGGSAGYEGTFRVVCYSAAPMVLALVPVFGMWVGGIWQLVCLFYGFKLVHDLSSLKAALPIVLVQIVFLLLVSGVTGLA